MWHKIKAYYNNSDHIFSLQWNESRKNPEKAKVTHNMNQDAIFVILLRKIHCGGSIVRLEIGDIVVTIYSSYICTGVFTEEFTGAGGVGELGLGSLWGRYRGQGSF